MIECKVLQAGIKCNRAASIHILMADGRKSYCCNDCGVLLSSPFYFQQCGHPMSAHFLCPDCPMPGAVWDKGSNTCNVPDSFCQELADALRHEFDEVAA